MEKARVRARDRVIAEEEAVGAIKVDVGKDRAREVVVRLEEEAAGEEEVAVAEGEQEVEEVEVPARVAEVTRMRLGQGVTTRKCPAWELACRTIAPFVDASTPSMLFDA